MKQITDEDICAKCGNCHRLTEVGPPPWDVMAVCDEGFPFTRVFHNVISECPSLLLTHNALAQADAACGVSPGAMGSAAHYGGRNETD